MKEVEVEVLSIVYDYWMKYYKERFDRLMMEFDKELFRKRERFERKLERELSSFLKSIPGDVVKRLRELGHFDVLPFPRLIFRRRKRWRPE